jgi:hypothetical protein
MEHPTINDKPVITLNISHEQADGETVTCKLCGRITAEIGVLYGCNCTAADIRLWVIEAKLDILIDNHINR